MTNLCHGLATTEHQLNFLHKKKSTQLSMPRLKCQIHKSISHISSMIITNKKPLVTETTQIPEGTPTLFRLHTTTLIYLYNEATLIKVPMIHSQPFFVHFMYIYFSHTHYGKQPYHRTRIPTHWEVHCNYTITCQKSTRSWQPLSDSGPVLAYHIEFTWIAYHIILN